MTEKLIIALLGQIDTCRYIHIYIVNVVMTRLSVNWNTIKMQHDTKHDTYSYDNFNHISEESKVNSFGRNQIVLVILTCSRDNVMLGQLCR